MDGYPNKLDRYFMNLNCNFWVIKLKRKQLSSWETWRSPGAYTSSRAAWSPIGLGSFLGPIRLHIRTARTTPRCPAWQNAVGLDMNMIEYATWSHMFRIICPYFKTALMVHRCMIGYGGFPSELRLPMQLKAIIVGTTCSKEYPNLRDKYIYRII